MPSLPLPARPEVSETDEVTPLLAAPSGGLVAQAARETDQHNDVTESQQEDDQVQPLPRGQMFLLCYARLVDPIAFFSIFPIVNQMIKDIGGIEEADVGFYSGLIESLFSLTQMLLMIAWGRAADHFGRKPVLVVSLAGVSVSVALFGLCASVKQMILLRCLAGSFAGTVVTLRTMTSEISTPRTQARAFSLFAFSGNLGIFFGPLISGSLANPASQYPSVFGGIRFFHEYPYALSTFGAGVICASATIFCALFVKETLKGKIDGDETTEAPKSTMQILKTPGVGFVLFIYTHTMLLAFAYTPVAPIFQSTSSRLGGFGFTPLLISVFLAIAGASQAVWVLLVFPPLQHRIGTGGVLRACFALWPLFFIINPVGNILLRHDLRTAFWALIPPAFVLFAGVAMAFTAVQLALNDIAPSPATLGTLNGLSLTFASGVRAFAPALFASIYAQGVRSQVLGGYVIWVILSVLALIALGSMPFFPAKAEGKLKPLTNASGESQAVGRRESA